ncbi:MAG TPA: glutathione-disulfide reductase, partial [Methyloceanibacter sp.]|nr:glutathione-disulfide reductase [Methyloceanibacter sp.]
EPDRVASYDYDLFVIGAGSGGVRAARLAAELGARVAIAEEYRVGGTCVIRGCVPKKLLAYGSHYHQLFEDAGAYGWSFEELRFDWPALIGNVQAEVERLEGVYKRLLENAGVEIFPTRAVLTDPHTVHLAEADRSVTAKTVLVATGGHPIVPDVAGKEHFITSNECFQLETLPQSVAIVGPGYIGVEFASIFAGLGVDVTLVYRGKQILRGFDDELRMRLADGLRARGIEICLNADIKALAQDGDGVSIAFMDGGAVHADKVVAATGRVPNTAGIGLQQLGVELGWNGHVVVNEYSQSSIENIYAVGDVTDRANLTPVAIYEAQCFAETLFNDTPTMVEHTFIPTAVFSEPELAAVGLTEEEAREKYRAVDIYKAAFRPLKNTLPKREQQMFLKLVIDAESDRVLGCHVLGPDAAEIVQMAAIAVRLGVTKAQFDATRALHPTVSEELVTMRHRWEPPTPVAGSDAAA